MKIFTCAELIVENLVKRGVDTIFGMPGAQTYWLFDALAKYQDDIRLVVPRHEQGAGYMAYGYARSTGKIGVYCAVPGPGVLNSASALCTAHNARVMCIAGQIPSSHIGVGHGMLHELSDQLGILSKLTKWASRVDAAHEVPELMAMAFKKLTTGRPGPVVLEVPMDVLAEECSVPPVIKDFGIDVQLPASELVEQAVSLVQTASNPMIVVGSGAIHAKEEVRELAGIIQAPVVSFRGGRGIVPDDSPYGFNCVAGYKFYPESDLVIGIGTRMELPIFRWQKGVPDKKFIRIDIDPTQHSRFLSDVAIKADAKLTVSLMIDNFRSKEFQCETKVGLFDSIKNESSKDIERVQPQISYLRSIRRVLPHDAIVVEEISQVGFSSWFGFPVYDAYQLISCGFQGNLGHGLQTALGVKVANPEKIVCSIVGDGGLMFGVQELATAVQDNIGIIVLLFNNNCYGNVRRDQINLFSGRVFGSDRRNPDFVDLATSFGVKAWRLASDQDFESSMRRAIDEASRGPVLIEIPVETGSEASAWEFIQPAGYGS